MSRTYVVTGATGFVGGHLARELMEMGHRVVALVRDGTPPEGCDVVRGELEDLRTCERLVVGSRCDGVFHLAAQAIVGVGVRDPFGTFESNVRGTYNLLEACRRHLHHQPIVVASSDKAYGELRSHGTPGKVGYLETDPLDGRSPYDCSKSCTDLIAQSYAWTYNLNLAIVRAGNIYGPGDTDLSRIVPSVVDDIVNERQPRVMSDGTPVRDYLYVADATAGYRDVAEWLHMLDDTGAKFWPGEAFNLAGGDPMTVLELVSVIQQQAKRASDYPIVVPEIVGTRGEKEIPVQILDTEKARLAFGWRPRTSIAVGAFATVSSHPLCVRRHHLRTKNG